MRRYGIERQTLLVALIPILVMAVLLENHSIYTRFADLDRALLERSQLMVRQLSSSGEYAVFSGNMILLQQNVDAARVPQDVHAVAVLDADGNVLLQEGPQQGAYGSLSARVSLSSPIYQDDDVLVLYEPIVSKQINLDELERESVAEPAANRQLGAVIIEVGKQHLNKQKREILFFNLLVTLLILMVTLAVALWAARRVTNPILGMNLAIRRIGEGALDTRIAAEPRAHELNELANGINEMVRQLQQDRNTLQLRIDESTRELRQKKEEAENASYDKTRFLAAASHDLRQPMHALGLFVGELHSKVSTPEQIRVVKKIEESISAMSELLNSLLDISKLDAGAVIPKSCIFPVNQVLGRMAQDYASVAEYRGVALRVKFSAAEVICDPILLERILLNLVNNALRYTPQHGCVLVACRKRGDRLRIEVRDNGIGIPQHDQKNIFREFYQLANTERDRGKGLGLGLAIVERLAKLLGTPLLLRSAPGRGSLFAIDVPLFTRPAAGEIQQATGEAQQVAEHISERVAHEQTAIGLEGARVLLVEDDPLVRASTSGVLHSWGCTVCSAASLQQVQERFSGENFDLLICDYRLPDGTGLEVMDWIKKSSQMHTPAILISADTAPEVFQQVALDNVHFLHKPVRPAKLRSLALYLLAGRS